MAPIPSMRYRRYEIRLWQDGEGIAGRPFLGSTPMLPQLTTATKAETLAIIQARLDARDAEREQRRRSGIPAAEEYIEALLFLDADIEAGQRAMLHALYSAPGRTLTATQLAEAAGYRGYSAANLKFGQLGAMIGRDLGMHLPTRKTDTSTKWTTALATGPESVPKDAQYPWTMRPEVAEALDRLPASFLSAGSR